MKPRLLVALALVLLLAVVPAFGFKQPAFASGLNNRSLTLGRNIPGLSTTYLFGFDITDVTSLGSISFEVCNNSALPQEVCVAPPGFDISSAGLTTQTGETGFVIDPGSLTNNYLRLTRPSTVPTLQHVTYSFDNVINPTDVNRTFYVRLQTYSASDGSGLAIEDGAVAASTSGQFAVAAFVPPFLEFCVGISITGNDCTTASGDLIDFGILSDSAPALGTSQINGATNGIGGLAISVIGTTMTSGVNVIDPLNVRASSVPGINQFGINLRANGSPTAGLEPSGPGTTVPLGDYNVPNEFAFRNGDVIANSTLPTDYSTLTITYLVNISSAQPPGVYTSTLTYVASAAF